MTDAHRREFLRQAGLGAAAVAATQLSGIATAEDKKADNSKQPAANAQDKLVMGWIGCGGQATNLLKSFISQPDVAVAYVCDPETARAVAMAQDRRERIGQAPKIIADMRELLDDKSVDAVCVATPDHWHAPATILACDAGKHVYVEKPCSHNLREGRLMVDAARRDKRVVQVGTQSRSSPAVIEAIQLIRNGEIGEVLIGKVWNSQHRKDIGHGTPGQPPAGLDYDLWVGPAPMVPFQANRIHYGWHWWYDFGTGDMGNDGVHDIDIARWGLGLDMHPATVTASGGKLYFDDDQQFPDTQYVVFDYPGDGHVGQRRQIIFGGAVWSPYRPGIVRERQRLLWHRRDAAIGQERRLEAVWPQRTGSAKVVRVRPGRCPHHRDFIDAVRARPNSDADIEVAGLSTAICPAWATLPRVWGGRCNSTGAPAIHRRRRGQRAGQRQYREHWARRRCVATSTYEGFSPRGHGGTEEEDTKREASTPSVSSPVPGDECLRIPFKSPFLASAVLNY